MMMMKTTAFNPPTPCRIGKHPPVPKNPLVMMMNYTINNATEGQPLSVSISGTQDLWWSKLNS